MYNQDPIIYNQKNEKNPIIYNQGGKKTTLYIIRDENLFLYIIRVGFCIKEGKTGKRGQTNNFNNQGWIIYNLATIIYNLVLIIYKTKPFLYIIRTKK